MAKCWMRQIEITFSDQNNRKRVSYSSLSATTYSFHISGTKYMGTLKDCCTITIDNLPYSEMVQLINCKLLNVDVKAGYKTTGMKSIFSGGVLFISTKRDDNKTTHAYFLCGSKLIANYHQARINFTLNSGINLYTAVRTICKSAGINNANISQSLKGYLVGNLNNVNGYASNWFEKLINEHSDLITNSDSIENNIVTIYSSIQANEGNAIKLTSNLINLTRGFPQLNSSGCVVFTCTPTIALKCGDIIELDNSLIQIPVTDRSEIINNYAYKLDPQSHYMVYEINFDLENRGSAFDYQIKAKPVALFKNALGTN